MPSNPFFSGPNALHSTNDNFSKLKPPHINQPQKSASVLDWCSVQHAALHYVRSQAGNLSNALSNFAVRVTKFPCAKRVPKTSLCQPTRHDERAMFSSSERTACRTVAFPSCDVQLRKLILVISNLPCWPNFVPVVSGTKSVSRPLLWFHHIILRRLETLSLRLLWHPRAGSEHCSRLIARGGYHGHRRLCDLLTKLPV